jgi:hypothetical protein
MANRTCSIDQCERPSKAHGMCGMHNERRRRNGDANNPGKYALDPLERLAQYVSPGAPDECWIWRGTTNADGYGAIRIKNARLPAHRFVYEVMVGPIPDGLHLDHVWARGCTSRSCVNPAHLEPVTLVENVMRGNGVGAVNARKTTCPQGHEYDKVWVDAIGRASRQCSTCQREWARRNPRRRRTSA